MNRRLLASLIVGSGLAWGAFTLAPVFAQDDGNQGSQSNAAEDREEGEEDSSQGIDKALKDYQNRVDQDLEQTRNDVQRMRKELSDLIEMRFDMAIAAAELRAHSTSHQGQWGGMGQARAGSEQERRSQHTAALNNELRQVQDQLRGEIQQARSQIDQLVAQLRSLRDQDRQIHERMRAEQERNKPKQDQDQGRAQQSGGAQDGGAQGGGTRGGAQRTGGNR